MSEYERLVQDRRDADRARNMNWKARAEKAEAQHRDLLADLNEQKARATKAEGHCRYWEGRYRNEEVNCRNEGVARLKAEAELAEGDRAYWKDFAFRADGRAKTAELARLKAEAECVEIKAHASKSLHECERAWMAARAARIKAEEALRDIAVAGSLADARDIAIAALSENEG